MHVECERLFLWYLSIWQFNLRIRHTVTTIRISRSFLWYEMNELMHVMWLWFLGIWNGRFSRLLNLIYGCKIECLQGCFVKNYLLVHYFQANLRFFPMRFLSFKNVPCKAFYSWKNGLWNGSRQCGIHCKLQPLLHKTCLSYASETLVAYKGMCSHMHALACIRRPRPTYTSRGPLWSFYFQK